MWVENGPDRPRDGDDCGVFISDAQDQCLTIAEALYLALALRDAADMIMEVAR